MKTKLTKNERENMRKSIFFLLILFLGLISNSESSLDKINHYQVENKEVFSKIEYLYNYILTHPHITKDEKELITNFQIRWKNYYEKAAYEYKITICSEDKEGLILETEVWNFKNETAKRRMETLANVCRELESRL